MEQAPQKAEAGLPDLIRKVLGSPHAEQAIKHQIIQLAARNLHVPEVTTALLEVLPLTRDKETKDRLIGFLANLNTSRFADTEALYTALLNVFKTEKERAIRTWLLGRLQAGLHQDPRLAPFFLELMKEPLQSEEEQIAVQQAIASLPVITAETALHVLQYNVNAPTVIQTAAITLAERCPAWNEAIIAALQPYLDVKTDRDLRFRILSRMAEARSLTPASAPLLIQVLRTDPDATARDRALAGLSRIRPWDAEIIAQLLWSATQDGDEIVRGTALSMQKEMPEPNDEHLVQLAGLLATDRAAGVRMTLLDMLKPVMRIKEVRDAVAGALAANPGIYDNSEFNCLVEMLAPYAGREEAARDALLGSIAGLPNAAQREQVLQLIIPKVKIETVLGAMVRLFRRERNNIIRDALFRQIRALSITRHPELVEVFCTELTEPGSPYREACAGILANVAEQYPAIVTGLEDVLQHDQERELVRLCLDGYLRPNVARRFDVLLEVVRNEAIDIASRQRALDAIMQLQLEAHQQDALTAALSGMPSNTFKI